MKKYLVLSHVDFCGSVIELFDSKPARSGFPYASALFSVKPETTMLDFLRWKFGSYVSTEKIREVKSW